MAYQQQLIAPFVTGLQNDLQPWLLPNDAFTDFNNGHIQHGVVQKRPGYRFLAQMQYDDGAGSYDATNRIMGIYTYVLQDGSKKTLVFDTKRAGIYDAVSNVIDPLDLADIFDSSDTDYIWAVNWEYSEGINRLFFTNGKAYDGASLNGIRYYESTTGTATTTTSLTPSLGGGKTLYGSKLLFSVQSRLVALYTYENGGAKTIYPQRARWCQAQTPSVWDDTVKGQGGFVDAPTGDQIISARQIQNQIIVFFTNSVWILRPQSDPALPFIWQKVNDYRACDAKMGSTGYDRYVAGIGIRGITVSNGVETKRIDDKIPDFVIDEINASQFDKSFTMRDYPNKRTWTLYSSGESDDANKALIWDDDSKSWSTYSIDMNVLGYGTLEKDYGLDDFVAANDLDISIEEGGGDSLQDYFFQAGQEVLMGGDRGGLTYIMNVEDTDNGSEFNLELESAFWNPYRDQSLECQLGYIDFYVDSDLETTFKIEFFKNDDIYSYAEQYVDCLPNIYAIADINSITQANPASVNIPDHGLATGDTIYIYGVLGMNQINGGSYTITKVNANTVTLDGVDSSAYNAYTTGGTAYKNQFYRTKVWKRAFGGGVGYQHRIKITTYQTSIFNLNALKPYFQPVGKRILG